jgi:hypothetical protein
LKTQTVRFEIALLVNSHTLADRVIKDEISKGVTPKLVQNETAEDAERFLKTLEEQIVLSAEALDGFFIELIEEEEEEEEKEEKEEEEEEEEELLPDQY